MRGGGGWTAEQQERFKYRPSSAARVWTRPPQALVDVKQRVRDIECGRVCACCKRMKVTGADLCARCAVQQFLMAP